MRFMPEFAVQLSLKAISAMEIECSECGPWLISSYYISVSSRRALFVDEFDAILYFNEKQDEAQC
jgi:hypothetical protein